MGCVILAIDCVLGVGNDRLDRAFETMVIGKKLAMGTGNFVHGLTPFQGTISCTEQCPSQQHCEPPSHNKAQGDQQRLQ